MTDTTASTYLLTKLRLSGEHQFDIVLSNWTFSEALCNECWSRIRVFVPSINARAKTCWPFVRSTVRKIYFRAVWSVIAGKSSLVMRPIFILTGTSPSNCIESGAWKILVRMMKSGRILRVTVWWGFSSTTTQDHFFREWGWQGGCRQWQVWQHATRVIQQDGWHMSHSCRNNGFT